MADLSHLYGSCACERNQYTIIIPSQSASLAQVFFDNSTANRRAQAAPVTAWLRVPLDWYQSATVAQFPDESHSSIKRIFHAPTTHPALPPTRRHFCGYCGTTLSAWNEGLPDVHGGDDHLSDFLDVTLGSLQNQSLEKLEELHIVPDSDEEEQDAEESAQDAADGLVKQGASINDEDHVPTNEEAAGGVDAPMKTVPVTTTASIRTGFPAHRMQSRGMPFFEEMVEHSRFGRIKRQVGGHTSQDGRTRVQWEVVEIQSSDEHMADAPEPGGNKRQKLAH